MATQETYVETFMYREDEIHPISAGFPLRHIIPVCESNMQGEFDRVAPMVLAFYHRWGEPARQADWADVYTLSTDVLLHLLAHGTINEDQLFTQMEYEKFRGLRAMMRLAYAHRCGALNLKKVEEMEKQAGSTVDPICYAQSTRDLVDRYINQLFEVEMQRRNAPTEATEAFSSVPLRSRAQRGRACGAHHEGIAQRSPSKSTFMAQTRRSIPQ